MSALYFERLGRIAGALLVTGVESLSDAELAVLADDEARAVVRSFFQAWSHPAAPLPSILRAAQRHATVDTGFDSSLQIFTNSPDSSPFLNP